MRGDACATCRRKQVRVARVARDDWNSPPLWVWGLRGRVGPPPEGPPILDAPPLLSGGRAESPRSAPWRNLVLSLLSCSLPFFVVSLLLQGKMSLSCFEKTEHRLGAFIYPCVVERFYYEDHVLHGQGLGGAGSTGARTYPK